MTDWHAWYAEYDDPGSSHSRRLTVVRRYVADALARGEVRRVLSLCAGDGRDLIPVLAQQPIDRRPDAVLVELDPALAQAARDAAGAAGVAVRVITGDAGWVPTWRDVAPVELLLLCGIFGNVTAETVHAIVGSVPALLAAGGTVIWTRGRKTGADMRPRIRQWFRDFGLEEIAFESEAEGFGVGVNRAVAATADIRGVPDRLFAFAE